MNNKNEKYKNKKTLHNFLLNIVNQLEKRPVDLLGFCFAKSVYTRSAYATHNFQLLMIFDFVENGTMCRPHNFSHNFQLR